MECRIKILTPIHIGSGNTYGAHEYYTGKSKGKEIFTRIDITKFYSLLEGPLKDKFLHHISTPEFKLDQFKDKIDRKSVKKAILYRGYLFSNPENIKEVQEHIKTLNQVYIPGSSIKGSLRTALLYTHLTESDLKEISNILIASKRKNKKLEEFINRFFATKNKDFAKYNITRFLQITDTTTFKSPAIYEIKILRAQENHYNYKNFKLHLECIPRIKPFLHFEIRTEYNDNFNILRLKDKINLIDIDTIKESLYKFSEDYIKHELDFASKYNIESLRKEYKKLRKENSKKTPLMKIGQGSGFLGTTIALRFKNEDRRTYELIRNITKGKNYKHEFPKTRRLINGKKPLGWVKVIFDE